MTRISARGLLTVWERGYGLHPVDQALTLLAEADPTASTEELAALSLGERNARLIALREGSFGPLLHCRADCRRCGEQLELTLSTTDLAAPGWGPPPAEALVFQHQGRQLTFRSLNSRDLAAIVPCERPEDARWRLAERVLLDADGAVLTPELVEELAHQLAACDPLAEVMLILTCPACDEPQELVLDIASFFWTEITAEAQRLLREVSTLARAYGWREADILEMSATRRHLYLEMVG